MSPETHARTLRGLRSRADAAGPRAQPGQGRIAHDHLGEAVRGKVGRTEEEMKPVRACDFLEVEVLQGELQRVVEETEVGAAAGGNLARSPKSGRQFHAGSAT